MWGPTLALAALLAIPSQALHFFIDGAQQKCFFEELPKDTLVVGTWLLYFKYEPASLWDMFIH
jgi:hypothetical protein